MIKWLPDFDKKREQAMQRRAEESRKEKEAREKARNDADDATENLNELIERIKCRHG